MSEAGEKLSEKGCLSERQILWLIAAALVVPIAVFTLLGGDSVKPLDTALETLRQAETVRARVLDERLGEEPVWSEMAFRRPDSIVETFQSGEESVWPMPPREDAPQRVRVFAGILSLQPATARHVGEQVYGERPALIYALASKKERVSVVLDARTNELRHVLASGMEPVPWRVTLDEWKIEDAPEGDAAP